MRPLLGIVAVFTAAATAAFAAPPPTWALVVRPFGSENREMAESFWVGLRNASDKDRAFCGLGVRYTFELANGSLLDRPSVEYPVVGSPHTCADSMGTLVLAGETYFVQVRPRIPRDAVRSAGVRFWVVAEEACLTPKCREHPAIMVSEAP
jgi:alkanesulfonate monooxygenase SsuD/methylene tetrahydromethanopterin reductase-like flavin-dependent oxidoreductase (luciferase family)